MSKFGNVIKQLQNERTHTQQQLEQLDQVVSALERLGRRNGFHSGRGGTRHISAAARNRIAAAQKARWAKWHQQHGAALTADGKGRAKRIVSAASRRKMATAQRARWAKTKKAA